MNWKLIHPTTPIRVNGLEFVTKFKAEETESVSLFYFTIFHTSDKLAIIYLPSNE